MRIDTREARIAFSYFCYALVVMATVIALFATLASGRANKPIDCSWRNQSGRATSQVTSIDWHCADSDYIAKHQ